MPVEPMADEDDQGVSFPGAIAAQVARAVREPGSRLIVRYDRVGAEAAKHEIGAYLRLWLQQPAVAAAQGPRSRQVTAWCWTA